MRGASGACGPKGQPYVDREGVFLSGGGGGEGRAQKAGRQQEPLLVESLKCEEGTRGG